MALDITSLAREAVVFRGALQKPKELEQFGRLMLKHEVMDIVEIGTAYGGTAWFLYRLGLNVVAIDVCLSRCAKTPGISYLKGNSSQMRIPCDAVLIDGNHSYGGVLADWLAWRGQARKLVAFHDIIEHHPDFHCEVDKLWRRLKVDYKTLEILDPTNPLPDHGYDWAGIGVVLLEKESNDRG